MIAMSVTPCLDHRAPSRFNTTVGCRLTSVASYWPATWTMHVAS